MKIRFTKLILILGIQHIIFKKVNAFVFISVLLRILGGSGTWEQIQRISQQKLKLLLQILKYSIINHTPQKFFSPNLQKILSLLWCYIALKKLTVTCEEAPKINKLSY